MPQTRMRSFNKYVTNHVTRRFAHFQRGPFALVRHVGRRSGKTYETPIMVEHVGGSFLIALTYGPDVDWYRNVQAAGHCTLIWHRRVYALDGPEAVSVQAALPAFPPPQRRILRLLGTQDFVRMQYREVETARPRLGEGRTES
ncbi:MAG: nitroreductase family deazaflavin-dependent oxidoreductase [Ktedonobacterales bacterium]